MTVNLLYAWGDNIGNGLGLGDEVDRSSPEQVGSLNDWSSVVGGSGHTAAVKTDGTLWTWGDNTDSGQLGLEDTDDRSSPVQVGALTDWSSVGCGGSYTAAVKTDSTLWTWGQNTNGQLGIEDRVHRSSPVQVGSLTNWSSVACGYDHTAAIKTDGTLWAWGYNGSGRLGIEDTDSRSSPEQVGLLTTWSSVGCGGNHTTAIKTDGTIWAWGYNLHGQLGLEDTDHISSPEQVGSLTDWSGAVACGTHHTAAIKTDGTLWTWGYNADGALGIEDEVKRSSPEQVGALTNWSDAVACGNFHTAAIKTDGTLWTWGDNSSNGQLGLEDIDDRASPEQVGSSNKWLYINCGGDYTLGIQQYQEGSVCWGHETDITTDNTTPMLGNWTGTGTIEGSGDTEKMTLDTPQNEESESWYTGTGKYVVSIDKYRTGTDAKPIISYKTATTKDECEVDGTLWSWGDNSDYGMLGLEDTIDRSSPVQVGLLTDWSAVGSGESHTAAIKTDGTLWTWGYNVSGQLGLGDVGAGNDRSSPEQVGTLTDWSGAVAGVGNHTAAIKTDNTIWTWGGNTYGQLGLEDTASRSSPEQVGSSSDWSSVAGGYYHITAIKTDGTLWTWGRNDFGQLGLEDIAHISSPEQVGSLADWSSVAGGGLHTAAIKTDGTIWTWGDNSANGQLGLEDIIDRSSPEQVGSLTDWSSITGGGYHTIAIKTDDTLWAWGINDDGQLGQEDILDKSSPEQVGSLTDWSSVICGGYHTAAIKTDGTIWIWGKNDYGQLGLGDQHITDLDRSSPEQVGSLTNWSSITCGFYNTIGIRGGLHNYADDKYVINSLGWVKVKLEI